MTGSCILVTGTNGFVGKTVVPMLVAAGHKVHAVVRPGTEGPPATKNHACDLTDIAAVDNLCDEVHATHLLHLAWCTGLREHKTSRENLRWVAAGARLIDAFRRNGGTRAVMAGTYAEYGTYSGICHEDTPATPAFLYASAKASLGALVLAYGEAASFPVTWSRLFVLYGAGEPPVRLIPQVAEALARGAPFETTSGAQIRDFIHVHDAARALVTLLGTQHHGVANIGTGTGRPVRDIVAAVSQRVGRPELIRFGARPLPVEESACQVADPATLRALGWAAHVPFEVGLYEEVDRIAAISRSA